MTCNRHLLLKVFLILLCTALAICFIQLGAVDFMKTVIASGYSGTSHHVIFVKPKLGPILSTNRSMCFSNGTLARPNISEELLKDILKCRAEYRQHQLRMGANLDRLIIAPDNSPLQYPITGFTVSPMQKSLIPSLALQLQKREVYKVSLSVKSGVLSVDDVLDGDQAEGQGQSNRTISASNLTQLSDLLSRVSYTSTIYHIRLAYVQERHSDT